MTRIKLNNYITGYMKGIKEVIEKLEVSEIEKMIEELWKLKKRRGRLFLLGIGGSGANCSHAVNDFRKICHIEAYTPSDNFSELTARINDDGWETIYEEWLKGSFLTKKDIVMVFSVGGGDAEKNISVNIIRALDFAIKRGATILGIVSRDGGYTKKVADVCIFIPVLSNQTITPYAESFQAILWHLFVNYSKLKKDLR